MLKKLLTDSWTFFVNHIVAISMIVLPIVAPIDILDTLYQYFLDSEEFVLSEQIIPMAIQIIAYPIYAVGVIFYIVTTISGETLDTKSLWALGVKYWQPYLVLSIFYGLAVVFGFMLLIIPGIIFSIRLAFSEFDLLLNQSKPLDAMRNSWDATKEYTWLILGGFVVITLALYVPYSLIASILDESNIFDLVLSTTIDIIYSVLGTLYTIFAYRVYEFAKQKG